jgi:hypothetical protein
VKTRKYVRSKPDLSDETHRMNGKLRGKYVKRYLSAQMEVSDLGDLSWPACASCARKAAGPYCEAFPMGIPEEIIEGTERHIEPYGTDGGKTYLPKSPISSF